MSAFIVTSRHINTIVTWAAENCIAYKGCTVKGHEQGFVSMLLRENVRSVNYRYPGESLKPSDFIIGGENFYKFQPAQLDPAEYDDERHQLAQIVMACNCYDYQACETDGYFDTPSGNVIATIRDECLRRLRMTSGQVMDRYNDTCAWLIND